MHLLKEYLEQCGIYVQNDLQEDLDMDYDIDNSDYVVVDGEEGDYGVRKLSWQGKIVAYHVVYGGDYEEIVFAENALPFFDKMATKAMLRLIGAGPQFFARDGKLIRSSTDEVIEKSNFNKVFENEKEPKQAIED